MVLRKIFLQSSSFYSLFVAAAVALGTSGAALASQNSAHEKWVDQLFGSKHGKLALVAASNASSHLGDSAHKEPGQRGSGGTLGTVGAHPTLVPLEVAQALKEATEAVLAAKKLIYEQDYDGAHSYIWSYQAKHPDTWIATHLLAIETSLLTKNYREAYDELVRELAMPTHLDDDGQADRYVQLSMAAAGLGETYPGQLEFVERQLRTKQFADHGNTIGDDVRFTKQSTSILAASSLALGIRNHEPRYLEVALELDPHNAYIAKSAVFEYWQRGQYSAARKLAATFVSFLPPGGHSSFFAEIVRKATGKKDASHIRPITP